MTTAVLDCKLEGKFFLDNVNLLSYGHQHHLERGIFLSPTFDVALAPVFSQIGSVSSSPAEAGFPSLTLDCEFSCGTERD
jgi:hypothetical protein